MTTRFDAAATVQNAVTGVSMAGFSTGTAAPSALDLIALRVVRPEVQGTGQRELPARARRRRQRQRHVLPARRRAGPARRCDVGRFPARRRRVRCRRAGAHGRLRARLGRLHAASARPGCSRSRPASVQLRRAVLRQAGGRGRQRRHAPPRRALPRSIATAAIATSRSACRATESLAMHDIRLLRDQMDQLREAMRRRGKLDELGPVLDRGRGAREGAARRPSRPSRRRRPAATRSRRRSARRSRRARTRTRSSPRVARSAERSRALEARRVGGGGGGAADPARAAQHHARRRARGRRGGQRRGAQLGHAARGRRGDRAALGGRRARSGCSTSPRGAKIAGRDSSSIAALGARLVRALMNFMLDMHTPTSTATRSSGCRCS